MKTFAEIIYEGSYSTFDSLVHGYAEEVIRCLERHIPAPFVFLDLMRAELADAGLEAHMDTLRAAAVQLGEQAFSFRMFLWPGSVRPEGWVLSAENLRANERINRARWQPYDETAWDRFFQEMVAQIAPVMPHVERFAAALDSLLARLRLDHAADLRATLDYTAGLSREGQDDLRGRLLDNARYKAGPWR